MENHKHNIFEALLTFVGCRDLVQSKTHNATYKIALTEGTNKVLSIRELKSPK